MDKNKAILTYLLTCDTIKNNPLYFQFINADDNDIQLITSAQDRALAKQDILGGQLKRYTVTLADFKSVTFNPVVKLEGYSNENIDDMADVQSLIDWVEEQNNNQNYPNFGDKCFIQEIHALTITPNMAGIDSTNYNPPLAKYTVGIQVTYYDTTECIV